MKYARIAALLLWGIPAVCNQQENINVNSRYTVDKIEIKISGDRDWKVSEGLREDMAKLIGQKFDQEAISALLKRVRKEMNANEVTQKLTRGETADHVIVALEVTPAHTQSFGVGASSTKALYHSKQGWSGSSELTFTVNGHKLASFGLTDDGDQLTERYAGLTARCERQLAIPPTISTTTIATTAEGTLTTTTATASDTTTTGTTTTTGRITKTTTTTTTSGKRKSWAERLKLGFLFEDYHIQWNRSTLEALNREGDSSAIYRTRQNFQPTLTLTPTPSVTLTAGVSFERFQKQFPAAHTGAANSVVAALRYRRQLGNSDKRSMEAGYSLRAATRVFSSDYVYARHTWDAGYSESWGNSTLLSNLTIGAITGRAPLFERYTLGNTTTLRGWNKYDIAPLGSNRMVHNTVEYRYRYFRVFYDTGSVWNAGENAAARHSAGVGFQFKFLPSLSVAFPIRAGRAEPVFMVNI